ASTLIPHPDLGYDLAMPIKESLRYWCVRILLSVLTAALVSVTAFVCAWVEYRNAPPHGVEAGRSLWDFTFHMQTFGVQNTCILAGILAFPLFLIYSTGLDGKRTSLIKVLIYNSVTILFVVLMAAGLALVHLPPIEDHH
ncbi:MAG TPA: hypothetical protein VFE62_06570, partial [Gemmataceae bacterium]|nr:hypothetical protein [Gemmataceae bacterium]